MIGEGGNALITELLRQQIRPFARPGIDHTRAAPALLDQFDDPLMSASALAFGAKGQLGSGETVNKFGGVGQV